MIITISGDPGSGKSTVRNLLAERLGLKKYSIGDLRGKMALDRGLNIDELNKLGEKKAFTDEDADEYQKKLGKEEDNFIIDGRLSYHFIPTSLKLFLKVDAHEGAKRIFGDKREDEAEADSVEEVEERVKKRIESDKKRYQKYYGLDYEKKDNYDLIIDTTKISAKNATDKIISFIQKTYK